MSPRTPSPVFLNCVVVPPLHESACPTLRVPHPPRSACFIAHPFHRPSPTDGLETFPLISRWLARARRVPADSFSQDHDSRRDQCSPEGGPVGNRRRKPRNEGLVMSRGKSPRWTAYRT